MKENLNLGWVFKRKEGLSFEEHGINAYQTMTHPIVGDFGHYRGTFDNPRALILADPQGLDDMLAARALTGERGQYLHGMMEDLGIKDQYLIIKTVPFGMDGASPEEWAEVLKRTSRYRETLLKEVLSRNRPELIISDGSYAELEIKKILLGIDSTKKTPLFHIRRSGDRNHWGFQAAFERIQKLEPFQDKGYRGVRADIPRSHLSYYARNWEGTSGDRVIAPEKSDPNYGKAVAIIAPEWATEQRVELPENIQRKVDKLREKLRVWGMRLPGESVPQFLNRRPDRGWDRRKMTPNPPQIGGSRCSTLFKLAS